MAFTGFRDQVEKKCACGAVSKGPPNKLRCEACAKQKIKDRFKK